MPAPTDILTLAFPLLFTAVWQSDSYREERHTDMRTLIAGLVIALGIAEIAMSAPALYAERTDITPPTMGPEIRTDPNQRRGTELSGGAILGLGARPTIEKRVVR